MDQASNVSARRISIGTGDALRLGKPCKRGFTLVELMVALSGGLFVTVVVFALARDASRFYA